MRDGADANPRLRQAKRSTARAGVCARATRLRRNSAEAEPPRRAGLTAGHRPLLRARPIRRAPGPLRCRSGRMAFYVPLPTLPPPRARCQEPSAGRLPPDNGLSLAARIRQNESKDASPTACPCDTSVGRWISNTSRAPRASSPGSAEARPAAPRSSTRKPKTTTSPRPPRTRWSCLGSRDGLPQSLSNAGASAPGGHTLGPRPFEQRRVGILG